MNPEEETHRFIQAIGHIYPDSGETDNQARGRPTLAATTAAPVHMNAMHNALDAGRTMLKRLHQCLAEAHDRLCQGEEKPGADTVRAAIS